MRGIKANFATTFDRLLFRKKSWGIVNRKDQKFVRNYNRTLKNGKGLSWYEATYETLTLKIPKFFIDNTFQT